MDLFLLCGIAVSLLGVIISLYFFQKKRNSEIKELQNEQRARNVPQRLQEGLPRRAQIMRNQRNRLRNSAAAAGAGPSGTSVINENRYVDNDNDDDDNDSDLNDNRNAISTDEKIGTKKRAKLEAKAEKRAQREAELQLREERKRKEQQLDEQRKIEEKKAEEEEKKRIEAERLAKEEKERKEYEEYLKLKENFSIDEEGYEENLDDDNGERNLLQEFIDYIKDNKVVVLEDVASHFKMKTQQVIERIIDLRDNNKLTGVIDDRGKFIYISENELKSVAKFIRQRGRISIAELAECSNNLINLNSIKC